jgi:hypothetical protein
MEGESGDMSMLSVDLNETTEPHVHQGEQIDEEDGVSHFNHRGLWWCV